MSLARLSKKTTQLQLQLQKSHHQSSSNNYSKMQSHADTVKKGYLKYKASKIKGRNAVSTQGPKAAYKEMFVVFRAPSGAEKFMDFYQNDRKYSEVSSPKWTVDLSSATNVSVFTENRVCFCLELSCGGACFFEAKTLDEAEEWIACFFAVLFTKGARGESNLYYEVDLYQSEHLDFHGPAYLELAERYLVVWTMSTQEEVVKWKLSHIRSFKAKKSVLTIYTGSRSATGVGEFYFNSPLSVQITHAIETLVAKLKSKKPSATPNGASRLPPGPRPLPPAPSLPDSTAHGIPGLIENGGELRRVSSSITASIPSFNDVYEDPDNPPRNLASGQNGRVGRFSPRTSPKRSRRPGGYEDIDVPDDPLEPREATPFNKKPSPPPIRNKEQVITSSGAIYAQVDKSAKRSKSPRPTSIRNVKSPDPPGESYGQLQYFNTGASQASYQPEEYGKLAHANKPNVKTPPQFEEYGRLEHVTTCVTSPVGEEYGKLDRPIRPNNATSYGGLPEYGKLDNAPALPPQLDSEEYGKLNGFDPYGTLVAEDLDKALKQKATVSGYEEMDFDDVPADGNIYSEVDNDRRVTKKELAVADDRKVTKNDPPPGYESTEIRVTHAEKASFNRHSSQEDPSPHNSPVPPPRTVKHKYVNVNDDGSVKTEVKPEIVPRRNRSNGVVSPSEEKKGDLGSRRKGHPFDNTTSEPQPPVPPQRGTTVYGPKRPPTAPKPKPVVKPKP